MYDYDVVCPGLCSSYLYSGKCGQRDCPETHVKKQYTYIDSHCHLDLLYDEYNFALKNANYPCNFSGCVANFVFPPTYHLLESLPAADLNVWPTLGLHPKYSSSLNAEVKSFLFDRASRGDIVAIGEAGLDRVAKRHTSLAIQQEAFVFQMEMAHKLNKPIVIHCRDTHQQALDLCKTLLHHSHKIHLHCFTGSLSEAHDWLDHFPNLRVGITNMVGKAWAHDLHELARRIPLESILLETDAPHFIPRGTRFPYSHPGLAINVAHRISLLRSVSIREVLMATTDSAKFIYGI